VLSSGAGPQLCLERPEVALRDFYNGGGFRFAAESHRRNSGSMTDAVCAVAEPAGNGPIAVDFVLVLGVAVQVLLVACEPA